MCESCDAGPGLCACTEGTCADCPEFAPFNGFAGDLSLVGWQLTGDWKLYTEAPQTYGNLAVPFESRVLGMTPDEVARYWIDRKIRGQGVPPKVVSPADLLQKVVSRLEHSIAYVRIGQVSGDVRVIAIDGHLPGDGSYGLSV